MRKLDIFYKAAANIFLVAVMVATFLTSAGMKQTALAAGCAAAVLEFFGLRSARKLDL